MTEPKLASSVEQSSLPALDAALEAAGWGAWQYTFIDGNCHLSARAQHLYGVDATPVALVEIVERSAHPDDVARRAQAWSAASDPAGNGLYNAEYRVRRREGGWRWLSVWGHTEFAGDGPARRPVRMTGASCDITERKRAEIFLGAQKRSLEMMVGGAPLADVLTYLTLVVERQSDGEVIASILFLDENGCLRNGASPSLPGDYLQAIDGLKARADLGTCSRAAATRQVVVTPDIASDPYWQAIKHLPLDLGLKAAWSQPIRARDGSILGTFGTYFRECREPSAAERQAVEILSHTAALAIERKRAEEALHESERKLQTLIGNLPGMAYRRAAEPPFALGYASEGAFDLTGRAAASLTPAASAWADLVHPDDAEGVVAEYAAAVAERRLFEMVYRLRHADGTTRWVLDRGRGIYDPASGAPLGIEGFVGDITAQRQAEEALREGDRRKDEFIATLSHELRNPLAPLRTALHLFRARPEQRELAERLRGMMERQVDQLVRLVDDLLEVSRISRGTLELRRERVGLAEIVRAAIETTEPTFQRAGHTLGVRLPDEPLFVHGDPVRLAQIVANLLNNAATYTDAGGSIALEARRADDAVEISVRDNGVGIAPEMLPTLFEMFARGRHTEGRHRGGLGIGLALARRLAEMHGGALTAASDGPGHGSEFTLRLPLDAAPRPHVVKVAGAPAPPTAIGRRVLVADDNVDAAEITALLLQQLGCDVHTVFDGESAFREAERLRPEVVLLDIGMPGANGYEVCRRIKREPWGVQMAVVAVTGWGQERDHLNSTAAGFDRHLVKPVEPGALADLLRNFGSAAGLEATGT